MHGKAKVKVSISEEEKKKKEREAKVKVYRDLMSQLWTKRRKEEFDDEALGLITEVLSRNPDIYTLWNFRRQIISLYITTKTIEELSKVLKTELNFMESCIKVNPKSYSAWHHRQWLLEKFPNPNFKKELELCTLYLKMDDRNFHCWDYRRWVAARMKVPDEKELKYTMGKINENFSNYSSWHYRSKLLPRIYPDSAGLRPISEQMHLNELELVVNAAFTDPNDQSAWFYQRWLLGRSTSYHPKPVRIVISPHDNRLLIAFNSPVSPSQIQIKSSSLPSRIWDQLAPCLLSTKLPDLVEELEIEVCDTTHRLRLADDSNLICWSNNAGVETDPISPALADILEEQLKMCNQLLSYEPDSKWTLLTSAHIMITLDRNKYKKTIIERMELLKQVDPLRINYYSHLLSKYLIENELARVGREFSLSANLNSLAHMQFLLLATTVDLSDNSLEDVHLSHFICLQSCKSLKLDGNRLTSLAHLPRMPRLESLSLSRNKFQHLDDIMPYLKNLHIRQLDISLNPVIVNSSSPLVIADTNHFQDFPNLKLIQIKD